MAIIIRRFILILFLVAAMATAFVWVFGMFVVKGIVETSLSERNISYESITIGGSPIEYKAVVNKPVADGLKKMGVDVQTDLMEFHISSSSFLSFDKVGVVSPNGVYADLGFFGVELDDAPEVNFKINKEERIIEDVYISLSRILVADLENPVSITLDVENINIPLDKYSNIEVYQQDKNIRLNKLAIKYGDLELELNGFASLHDKSVSTGWLDLSLEGYEEWLDYFIEEKVFPQQMVELVENIGDEFVTSEFLADKVLEISINIIDGDVTVNDDPWKKVLNRIVANNPDVNKWQSIFAEEIGGLMMMGAGLSGSFGEDEAVQSRSSTPTSTIYDNNASAKAALALTAQGKNIKSAAVRYKSDKSRNPMAGIKSLLGRYLTEAPVYESKMWDLSCRADSCEAYIEGDFVTSDVCSYVSMAKVDGASCRLGKASQSW